MLRAIVPHLFDPFTLFLPWMTFSYFLPLLKPFSISPNPSASPPLLLADELSSCENIEAIKRVFASTWHHIYLPIFLLVSIPRYTLLSFLLL